MGLASLFILSLLLRLVDPRTGVKEMWQDLYTKDPALLENFESFLCEVVSELKQSDTERSTLENHIRKYVRTPGGLL